MNVFRIPRAAVTLSAVLLLGVARLAAQESSLDTTFALRGAARVRVEAWSGDVTVRGSSRQGQIRVQAELERGARVEFDEAGGRLAIRSAGRRHQSEVSYVITVPTGTAVSVGGQNTDVDLVDVCGDAEVNAMNGDVNVRCATDVTIGTLSGDITLSDIRGVIEVGSTSGDIELRGARGAVRISLVSGDVTLRDISSPEVSVETVSGEIDFTGRLQDSGRYRLSAHSGEVTVWSTGTINAMVEVETFTGEFTSDFPIEVQPGTTIGKNWSFRLGTGSARLRLSSFSGSVNLRRGSSQPREE